jgi:hypothetical protein
MKDYKDFLKNYNINKTKILYLIELIINKDLTISNMHSRKAYAKRSGNLDDIITYSIVFEIIKDLKIDVN